MNQSLQNNRKVFFFRNDYLNIFVISLIVAAVIFLPFIIYEKGYFLYYGDFNVQQIPFYLHAHDAIRDGQIFWDWGTDLGANFIGSYSFYLLTSPFFLLTLAFPSSMVPLLMGPLLILKFGCAGLTGFAFLKRFTKNNYYAVIGALMYAFCGFNQFNIFFNHFHEAVILFPLLLVALEEFVVNGRRGCFALAVALCAVVNYFFFFGQVTFTIIYFIVRCFSPDFRINAKKFLLLLFEAVLGVLLACIVLLPSALAIIDNPRTSSMYYGMNMLLYNNVQRYGLILQSLFFPPDIPSRPNFFPDSNAKWSSVSAYLPLFSMSGVAVFCRYAKKHWLKRILLICGIMALVPILNSSFYAFNSSYYARWFYMPVLMMCLATCFALQDVKMDFSFGIKFCTVMVCAFALIGVLPTKDEDGVVKWFQFEPYPESLWAYVLIALLSVLLLWVLYYQTRHSKVFYRQAAGFICLISVISTMMVIGTGKQHASGDIYDLVVEQGIKGKENFTLDESEFYRVDEYELLDNMPMYWDMSTIQCFHSVVPASIMEFYENIDIDRDVASRPELSYYGLRALTSVKYLFAEIDEEEQPSLYGFELIGQQNGLNVYENQYFIPMGFTYDYYADSTVQENYLASSKDKLMLRAILLSDEDAQKYSDILERLPEDQMPDITEEDYYLDCQDRAAGAGTEFTYDTNGFTSQITLSRDNLVFYSVPYERGWTAYVNGEKTEIVKANVGFMAVKAPAGENTIVFRYRTPGLYEGIAVSFAALNVWILYVWYMRRYRRKHPEAKVRAKRHRLPYAEPDGINRAQYAYIKAVLSDSSTQEEKDGKTKKS